MSTFPTFNELQRGSAFITLRLIVGVVAAVSVSACGTSDKSLGVQVCCGESSSGPTLQPDTPPAVPTTSDDTSAILQYAQYCYRDSRLPEALAWLDTALVAHSRDPRLYWARGHVLFAMRQYLDAETSYGRAGLYGMPDSYLVYQLGEIKWKTGRYHEAIEVFQRGLTYFPENACILNSMGISYMYLGDNTKALSFYDRAISADPKVPFFYDNRSGIRRALGDEEGAINDMIAFRNLSRPPSSTGYRPLVERGLINY